MTVEDRWRYVESRRGKYEYAFPHRKGQPWWLTDAHGNGKEVGPVRWVYYRITRSWRKIRFNRRVNAA